MKLHSAGCKFSDAMVVLYMIYCLTPNYQQLHSLINTATNQSFLTLLWLMQALLQEEATINSFKAPSCPATVQALVTTHTIHNCQN